MKSILSKTMKYPKGKSTTATKETMEKNAPQQPPLHRSQIDIHEISTHSIIQTSALLHTLLNDNSNTTNPSVVISPTHSETIDHSNNDDDDYDDDSDTVQSNGASIRENDGDDDSEDAVVVMVEDCKSNNNADDVEVSNILHRHNTHHHDGDNTPNEMIISEECSVRVSSPLGEPKEVRFMDDVVDGVVTFHEHFNIHDEDDHAQQEQESLVLHEQLKNVLQDLCAEKAARFRKEKSLIKLAKQLKKRNQTIQVYETKLIQMAKFINTLQHQQQQLQLERELLQQPEPSRQIQVKEELSDEEQEKPEEEDVTEIPPSSKDTTTDTLKEHTALIESLHETIQTLRTELQESQLQLQTLQRERQVKSNVEEVQLVECDVAVVPTKTESHSTNTTATTQYIHPFMILVYLYGIVVVTVTILYSTTGMNMTTTRSMMQNYICAPIRPGTKLVPNGSINTIYEAPWWVPTTTSTTASLKSMIHATLCPHVPRTSLHWSGDKLMIHDLTKEDHSTSGGSTVSHTHKKVVLLQGRGPAGVQFHHFHPDEGSGGNTGSGSSHHVIQLLRTHRAGITLPAPWIA